ncbi:transposase [Haloarchaeobius sp. HME9146]|uniref:transposase n=1 Tax=Haloarchaeobius sp. HME9146 TaxID=2978732 RepID=UPI0021BE35DF|nr:transposase [Haloarchaeobius sp. HME9146]MCT9094739.1 conditioned medium-induced protein 4 [Haloarchaeobius sp. HME9146]
MDEKTEELRDIFMDVADGETVTETQEASRGSLADRGDVSERLEAVVGQLRERYEFRTDLDDGELCTLVRRFHEGANDTELADELDVSRHTAFRARMDLHLLREGDLDASFDLTTLRERLESGEPLAEVAEDVGVSESTLRRYRDAVAARDQSRAANDRYRDEFASILSDADISGHLTEQVRETGLKDATEDAEPESNVSF